jgi:hypothetical protein
MCSLDEEQAAKFVEDDAAGARLLRRRHGSSLARHGCENSGAAYGINRPYAL